MKYIQGAILLWLGSVSQFCFAQSNNDELVEALKDSYHQQKYVELVKYEMKKMRFLKDMQELFKIGDLERVQDFVASEMAATATNISQYRNRISVADGKNELTHTLNNFGKYAAEIERFAEIYNRYPRFEAFLYDLPYEVENEVPGAKNNTQKFYSTLEELSKK